ncbi:Inositol 2-dehydrogenase [Rosistilla oblonga]|uniref:Gfo/Idh/MocA family protein n=1 Tax=Rosistilla oblonga TaxID=2527990 RepID=UPI001187CDB7|nr:Gfo/Idh/MocA family oxidoreductase [Rosistilla oblonga]QDV10780.1 Inositol 2-dehydrogenase [Rosistilla oblonga]
MFDRRQFIASSVATTVAATAAHSKASAADANKPVKVGVMGLSRGMSLATDLAKMDGVEVKYICDVDSTRLASGAEKLGKIAGTSPEAITDFRKILDDKEVDALVCAAPNHWHGPATIMACKAGKHVYVEKPASHNAQEGEWMIEAAEKYNRVVQVGTQRRSAPEMIQAMEKLQSGAIGKVFLSRGYYVNQRGSIGKVEPSAPPENLDYALWEGPAPHREYKSNVVPYNWHWNWHWGGGELANNGVHTLDICRWGMGVDYPTRTTISGGRYCYDDDQITPDTQVVAFEFGDGSQITWQGTSCNKHNVNPFVSFYGTEGSMEVDSNGGFKLFNRANKMVEEVKGTNNGQLAHLTNFVDAVRSGDASTLNQPIAEGHCSTMMCHLGVIAYRTGQDVVSDPTNGHIQGPQEQKAMWGREYNPAWEADVSKI